MDVIRVKTIEQYKQSSIFFTQTSIELNCQAMSLISTEIVVVDRYALSRN